MKKLLFVVAFIMAANLGMAQDAAFKADVEKFIQLAGANAQLDIAKKQVVAMVPADKKDAFSKDFDAILKPIRDKQIAFYLKEFTHDEVKQLVKFYESPLGKKMSEKAVKQAETSVADSQELGMEIQGLMSKYMQ